MSEIRWNSLIGEWVIVTPRRTDDSFERDGTDCPFCSGDTITKSDWTVLTLDNKYVALDSEVGPFDLDNEIVIGAPGYGFSKVIIQTPNHNEHIEDMEELQLTRVLTEYTSVFKELSSKRGIEYVLILENRKTAKGNNQGHSHAQVYGLPFVPPKLEKEISQMKKYHSMFETCLICETIENEFKSRERVVKETENFVSTVPYGARIPYETHIYPKNHVSSLIGIQDTLPELGMLIKDTITRFLKILDETSYVMALHSSPSKGEHDYWHFHIEFYPTGSDTTLTKRYTGIETGGGVFINDSQPELNAKELREAL